MLSGSVCRLFGCGYFPDFLSRNPHLDGLPINLERRVHRDRDVAAIRRVK